MVTSGDDIGIPSYFFNSFKSLLIISLGAFKDKIFSLISSISSSLEVSSLSSSLIAFNFSLRTYSFCDSSKPILTFSSIFASIEPIFFSFSINTNNLSALLEASTSSIKENLSSYFKGKTFTIISVNESNEVSSFTFVIKKLLKFGIKTT